MLHRNFKLKTVGAIIIIIVFVLIGKILLTGSPISSTQNDGNLVNSISEKEGSSSDSNDSKKKRENSKSILLERLRLAAANKDADELILLVPLLHKKDMLLTKDVMDIYKFRINFFTAEKMADLANSWPDISNTAYTEELMVISDFIRERNDPAQYFQFIDKFSKTNSSRENVILKIGQRMTMFSPQEIGKHINHFEKSDRKIIAELLAVRVRSPIKPKETQIEIISQYLNSVSDVDFMQPLIKQYLSITATDNPLETLKWISEQNPEAVKMCDKPMIEALMNNHTKEAADYVNSILTNNDKDRSNKALAYMADSYTKKDPEGSFFWVINLPKDVGPIDQMLVTPFMKIRNNNPKRADEITNSIKDPRIKRLLQRVSE